MMLFGSFAKGDVDSVSDVDLLVDGLASGDYFIVAAELAQRLVQKLRSAAAGTRRPSWGTSRSRKLRKKSCRQARLAASDPVRKDRG